MADVIFAGKIYAGQELTSEERDLLFKHLRGYLGAGNDFLAETFTLNEETIEAAAMVAKDKFDAKFAGILAADGQFGFQLLRPGHILRTTGSTETPLNTWDSEGIQGGAFTSGLDNFIGYDTNNATAARIDREALALMMGAMFTQGARPNVSEIRFQVGETIYPVISLRHSFVADTKNQIRAVRFHPILAEPKQTVLAEVWSEVGMRQELVLMGLTFGLGRFLRTRNYTSVAT